MFWNTYTKNFLFHQIGGNDQMGNILAGYDLIGATRKAEVMGN